MKTLRPAPLSALLTSALVLGLAGCTTVKLDESGDTAAIYQINEFRMVLNTTAPKAFTATQKAIRDLDLFETKSKLNTYDGELYARTRADEKVFVGIAEINSRQTLVRIRWGTTGDRKNSTALYKLIESNLR